MSTKEPKKSRLGQLFSTVVFMIFISIIAVLALTDSSSVVSDANQVRVAMIMVVLAAMTLIVVDNCVQPESGRRSRRPKGRQV